MEGPARTSTPIHPAACIQVHNSGPGKSRRSVSGGPVFAVPLVNHAVGERSVPRMAPPMEFSTRRSEREISSKDGATYGVLY